MAELIRDDKGDGWITIKGGDGIHYGCQTKRINWWCRRSGIVNVYDVGEIKRTTSSNMVPADVVALADSLYPNRCK